MSIEISRLEVLVLKKLVLINHALATAIEDPIASREQRSLTEVLAEIAVRADLDHAPRRDLVGSPPETNR